ncbi:MAG: PAS domain S-box protein [Deltaproteobacteria bacterium]|nr:MAG: PAS domain S-box protein [Deltaproteobacteria bacterium]
MSDASIARRLKEVEELLESVGGIVWEADPETFEFHYVSTQAERLLGYPRARWLETPDFWLEHLHRDDRVWVPQRCREMTAALRSHDIEYRMIGADGRTVWVRDIVNVVADGGRPVRCRGVMVDISARKEAEEALRVSEQRLRTLVTHAPVVLFTVNRHGIIEVCEGSGLDPAGIDPSELIGLSYTDWPRTTPSMKQNVARALAGESFSAVLNFEERVYVVRYTPIWTERGGIDGMIGVATDVTERERAEQHRRQLEAQMQQTQRLESLGMLAGGIAHDFNNLLTTILGSASLALEDLPRGLPARTNVERIRRAAETAGRLTNQLLAYAGKNEFDIRSIDFSTFVEGMTDLLRVSVAKNAELRCACAKGLPAVDCDAAGLTQVVLNLVTNAAEAVGDAPGVIDVRTGLEDLGPEAAPGEYRGHDCAAGPCVYLEVSDTGVGMPAEVRSRIFDPFFSTKYPGRGLGLAAMLGIVHGHRGAVRVSSEPGRGTTFRVLFPCRPDTAPEPPAAGEASAAAH